MSIITPAAIERCAQEAAHREHVNALRAIELARADKRINDHYDKLLIGGEPERLGRRIFDRRSFDATRTYPVSRATRRPVADMHDIDLRLSV